MGLGSKPYIDDIKIDDIAIGRKEADAYRGDHA